ncbi:ATP-binding protein [Acinetobacter baumannii]|uniref:AAA family ATPase n=1 Tax=Acinetobacter baumannii TaxID=470 RepID=UPI0023422648|nr:ATP-binding protein [Acinetobacter baumannii]
MIIDFSIKNFRSIKDEQTISFEATNSKDLEKYFVFEPKLKHPKKNPLRLLKLNMIYGANGSGKSNIMTALHALDILMRVTSDDKDDEISFIESFKFNSETVNEPSVFKISFIAADKIIYHYELTATKTHIVEETLYSTDPGKGLIFSRTTDPIKKISHIDIKPRAQMKSDDKNTLINSTLWNSTVLATFDSLNIENEVFSTVIHWVEHTLMQPVSPKTDLKKYISDRIDEKKISKEQVIRFMKEADFCVSDLNFEKTELSKDELELIDKLRNETENQEVAKMLIKQMLNQKDLFFTHSLENGSFKLKYEEESLGTQRYYQLSGLLDIVTSQNKIIPIDEFESSLHPDLIQHFLLSYIKTQHNSQMLITTHYREFLLNKDIFRKDSIWFCDKNRKTSSTEIYSLVDFDTKTIRETSSVYNAYKAGKLGGTPNI